MTDEELRKIAENATPGPWITGGELPGSDGVFFGTAVDPDDPDGPGILLGEAYAPDAEFIATFNPELVVALLDRVEKAERRVSRLKNREQKALGNLREAKAALQRVRERHSPYWELVHLPFGDDRQEYCQACQTPYPCPTIRVLEGDE